MKSELRRNEPRNSSPMSMGMSADTTWHLNARMCKRGSGTRTDSEPRILAELLPKRSSILDGCRIRGATTTRRYVRHICWMMTLFFPPYSILMSWKTCSEYCVNDTGIGEGYEWVYSCSRCVGDSAIIRELSAGKSDLDASTLVVLSPNFPMEVSSPEGERTHPRKNKHGKFRPQD